MKRIYHRKESGMIETVSAKDWTRDTYLAAHPHLEYAHTEELVGWPDSAVDWYAVGGDECGTMRAVGFAREQE